MKHAHSTPPHHYHIFRIVLFCLLFIALLLTKSVAAGSQSLQVTQSKVLAYATNVSIGALLSATNSARAQNGLGALQLDSRLNSSSQNKAQHMINNNYWAHVAPDGTQPWYFFTQAGYTYTAAGENLAYGFDSSQATVDAWMNSPSHRANILGNYKDIGFGIANGEAYQGNQNTVVVAHYGTAQAAAAPAPAPAPAPTSTTPQATPSAPTSAAQPTVDDTSVPSATEPTPTPSTETEQSIPTETIPETKPASIPSVTTATPKNISLIESISARQAPILAVVSLGITIAAAGGFAMTHRKLFHHALATGENFVIHHPILDFATVSIVTVLILSSTMARIG